MGLVHGPRSAVDGAGVLTLGIDTSTSAIAVGLADATTIIGSRARIDSRGHTEHLAPLIADLLSEHGHRPRDLTAIAVGNGPGPFTGLRVGLVTALTMGHALGIPVHGICSLDVLADQAGLPQGSDLVVASDARRKEVYWARYAVARGRVERRTGPAVDRPQDLPADLRSLPTAGRGPLLYPDLFPRPVAGVLDVDAGVLAGLVRDRLAAGATLPVEALYLRRPDALTTAERAAR